MVDSLANMEASLERQNDGDEGTDLSRSGPKARMIFRRTQMQVTVSLNPCFCSPLIGW